MPVYIKREGRIPTKSVVSVIDRIRENNHNHYRKLVDVGYEWLTNVGLDENPEKEKKFYKREYDVMMVKSYDENNKITDITAIFGKKKR